MNRTCLKCGWVHFAVPRGHAENEIARFNAYYDTLTPKQQRDYYGADKSSIKLYEQCDRCGGPHTNFREEKEGDCPIGCTIGPIIHE